MTAARMLEAVAEGGPFRVEADGDRYYLVAGTGRMFGPVWSADRAAELGCDQLRPVADAEDRHPELVDLRIEQRRTIDVDALRTARQDDR